MEDTTPNTNTQNPPPPPPPKTVKKKKTETTYHPIPLIKETAGLAPEQIKKFRELEEKLISEDLYIYQVAETKNKLETYIYDSRAKLGEVWKDFSSNTEKESFNQAINSAYSWFESNPEAALQDYQNKLSDLLTYGNKIQKRVFENDELPGAISNLLSTIENYKAKATSGDPAYAHIDKTKMESIITECNRVLDLYKENIDKTSKLAKHDDPILQSTDLKERAKNLSKFCDDVLNTPKPKEEPKKPEEKKDDKTPNSPQTGTDKMETEQTPPTTPQQGGDKMDTETTNNQ